MSSFLANMLNVLSTQPGAVVGAQQAAQSAATQNAKNVLDQQTYQQQMQNPALLAAIYGGQASPAVQPVQQSSVSAPQIQSYPVPVQSEQLPNLPGTVAQPNFQSNAPPPIAAMQQAVSSQPQQAPQSLQQQDPTAAFLQGVQSLQAQQGVSAGQDPALANMGNNPNAPPPLRQPVQGVDDGSSPVVTQLPPAPVQQAFQAPSQAQPSMLQNSTGGNIPMELQNDQKLYQYIASLPEAKGLPPQQILAAMQQVKAAEAANAKARSGGRGISPMEERTQEIMRDQGVSYAVAYPQAMNEKRLTATGAEDIAAAKVRGKFRGDAETGATTAAANGITSVAKLDDAGDSLSALLKKHPYIATSASFTSIMNAVGEKSPLGRDVTESVSKARQDLSQVKMTELRTAFTGVSGRVMQKELDMFNDAMVVDMEKLPLDVVIKRIGDLKNNIHVLMEKSIFIKDLSEQAASQGKPLSDDQIAAQSSKFDKRIRKYTTTSGDGDGAVQRGGTTTSGDNVQDAGDYFK